MFRGEVQESGSEYPKSSQAVNTVLKYNYTFPSVKRRRPNPETICLRKAINLCKKKEIGIQEASIIYGVPKKTLRSKLFKENVLAVDEEYKVIVFKVFPKRAIKNLTGYLRFLISSGASLTPIDVRRFGYESAYEICKGRGLPKDKNCLLGRSWYKKFIANFPQIEPSKPNLDNLETDFYNTLNSLIAKHKLDENGVFYVGGFELKFRALGENDLTFADNRKTIFAKALCCINPAGSFAPPIFLRPLENCCETEQFEYIREMYHLFKDSDHFIDKILKFLDDFTDTGKNLDLNFLLTSEAASGTVCNKLRKMFDSNFKNLPMSENIVNMQKQIEILMNKSKVFPEEVEEEFRDQLYEEFNQFRNKIFTIYETTLNEVTPETFYNWFQTFVNFVKPQKKILLLLEDQNYIKCFRTLKLAKSKNIIFLVVPPRSCHKILPLDSFALTLNQKIAMSTKTWLEQNPNGKSEEVPLDTFFAKAFVETKDSSMAKNGFLFSGIWPTNQNAFRTPAKKVESVSPRSKPETVSPRSEPETVSPRSKPETVSPRSKPETVSPRSEPETVSPRSKPETVTLDNVSKGTLDIRSQSDFNAELLHLPKNLELQNLCRVCMTEKVYMKPIFDPTPAYNHMADKILDVAEVKVSQNDGLPSSICQLCLVHLNETVKMKYMTIDSYKKQIKLRYVLERREFGYNSRDSEKEVLDFLENELKLETQKNPKLVNHYLSKDFKMDSVCTVCMKNKPLMTSIFAEPHTESESNKNTSTKIMEVTQKVVHFHGGLSSYICTFCQMSINQASEFIKRVNENDKKFKEIIANGGH